MARVTTNDLLDAIREALPFTPPPPAPWMSTAEMAKALGMNRDQARRRGDLLVRQGKAEVMRATAANGGGMTNYYKLKGT